MGKKKAQTAAKKRGRGRPTLYSQELVQRICDEIASGKTLVSVCKSSGMPRISTVLQWITQHADFAELYTRAKELRLKVMAEELVAIADTSRQGKKTKRTEVGKIWMCPVCEHEAKWQGRKGWVHSEDQSPICPGVEKPKRIPIYETETVSGDMIERSKLMVETRKWLLARLASKTYGDRIATELSGPNGGPIAVIDVLNSRLKRVDGDAGN